MRRRLARTAPFGRNAKCGSEREPAAFFALRWMRGKEACIDSRWLNVLHILCKNPRNLEHSSTSVDSSSVASGLRDGAACAKRPTTHTRSGMFRVRWLSSGGPSVGPT